MTFDKFLYIFCSVELRYRIPRLCGVDRRLQGGKLCRIVENCSSLMHAVGLSSVPVTLFDTRRRNLLCMGRSAPTVACYCAARKSTFSSLLRLNVPMTGVTGLIRLYLDRFPCAVYNCLRNNSIGKICDTSSVIGTREFCFGQPTSSSIQGTVADASQAVAHVASR